MGLCDCAVYDLVFLDSFYKHLSNSCQGPCTLLGEAQP